MAEDISPTPPSPEAILPPGRKIRGLAFGDLYNDGRIDLVTNGLDNTLHVYRNIAPEGGNHWLGVRAMTGKRDALGRADHRRPANALDAACAGGL